jgi:hypothetical protein
MARRRDKKPFITLECNFEKPFTLFDDGKPRHLYRSTYIEFPTYRDFIRKLKQVSVGTGSWSVTLIRYKRGEWGEWFENWRCEDGKLSIERQGWM